MEDLEIIELYWNRQERAIAETADKYGSRLLRLGRSMIAEQDAEECVNDTYLAAWNAIPPTRPAHFFAWLAKICRNRICSRIAWHNADKRKAELVELTDELGQCLPDTTSQEAEADELGRVLSDFLRGLPAEKRYFFLRRYWFGDSIAEIAGACSCGESKVKVTLHRTRGELKRCLEQEGVRV